MENLLKRQEWETRDDRDYDDDYNGRWWGYSPQAEAIKWSVVGIILLILFLWLIGGAMHAKSRMRKGLRPLAYHRWLVSRHQRARFEPQPTYMVYQHGYGQPIYGQEYPMHPYPPPPPPYHAQQAPPPTYQPPEGASKMNPNQAFGAPPPGPPPTREPAGESSNAPLGVSPIQSPAPQASGPVSPIEPPKATLADKLNPFKRG